MENVVATLPLSPRRNAGLGFYTLPLIADVLASFAGTSVVHPLNVLGTKASSTDDAAAHYKTMEGLGIASPHRWCDGDEDWETEMGRIIRSAYKSGWLIKDIRTVMVCPCGMTEFLAAPSTLSDIHGSRSLYVVRGGKPFCLLCNGEAVSRSVPCLMVCMPDGPPTVRVLPMYAAVEWDQLAFDIAGREMLVSRIRETGIRTTFGAEVYNVDVDFAWKLFPERIRWLEQQCACIVVGHKTMKHALSIAMLNTLLGVPGPEYVIAVPYLKFDFGRRSVKTAEALIGEHGSNPLRWMLSMALGCTRKEMNIKTSLIHLIEHSIGVDPGSNLDDRFPLTPDQVWRTFNAQRIQGALAGMRRGSYESLSPLDRHLTTVLGLNPPR